MEGDFQEEKIMYLGGYTNGFMMGIIWENRIADCKTCVWMTILLLGDFRDLLSSLTLHITKEVV